MGSEGEFCRAHGGGVLTEGHRGHRDSEGFRDSARVEKAKFEWIFRDWQLVGTQWHLLTLDVVRAEKRGDHILCGTCLVRGPLALGILSDFYMPRPALGLPS